MTEAQSPQQFVRIVRPEKVAEKLQAIRNHEYPELLKQISAQPRLVEMMWFLQYVSMQPGGLVKFSADMVEQLPARFGTATMRGSRRQDYTLQEKSCILDELSPERRPFSDPDDTDLIAELIADRYDSLDDSETLPKQRREFKKPLKAWTAQRFEKSAARPRWTCCQTTLRTSVLRRARGLSSQLTGTTGAAHFGSWTIPLRQSLK